MEPREFVVHYHQQTKHGFGRYARSTGNLDWDNQPDPFRRFEGAPFTPLGLTSDESAPSYDDLFLPGALPVKPIRSETISRFFELSLAISAWKESFGARWALRINPSSGNLHPTEGYLVIGSVEGIEDGAGVYHYAPKQHGLERRTVFAADIWRRLMSGFPAETFLVGLTSIHWREAWKYGERAFRYCQHDAGHALAALSVSARLQGWRVQVLDGLGDREIARLLGLDRARDFEDAEHEHPDFLAIVGPSTEGRDTPWPGRLPPDEITQVASGTWNGRANQLSPDRVDWEIIDKVADACLKPPTAVSGPARVGSLWAPPLSVERDEIPASRIIRQRRSAVALDGKTGLTAQQFFLMLDRVLPRMDAVPFDALGPPACVHLGLFVHLIEGIPRGLYVLVRAPERLEVIRKAMRPSFAWKKPPGCPDGLPLFLLHEGDCRAAAWKVSCEQQIAGAGAFSCAMIAEFEPRLKEHGAWFYRRLFWETGMIGQVLYLEAEAAGVRATGIGCYFDDPVHDIFGLRDTAYQSLYHFTMGGPVEDTRLTTLPPYPEEGPG